MFSLARKLGKLPILMVSWVEEKWPVKHVPMEHFFMREKMFKPKKSSMLHHMSLHTSFGGKMTTQKITLQIMFFLVGAI